MSREQEAMPDDNEDQEKVDLRELALISPKRIVEKLNKHVVGQEQAKKVLAISIYNHVKRIIGLIHSDDCIDKTNLLLLGPTGCGKTHLIESICKEMEIPFGVCDAAAFTESGYWGEDVEQCLLPLYKLAGSVAMAERGIVYIDEIDKLAEDPTAGRRGVTGYGVQRSLLKIIEGKKVTVMTKAGLNRGASETVEIDTKHILFIFGGAFDGLGNIIKQRTGQHDIGFASKQVPEHSVIGKVLPEDVIKYGFMPEFMGRIPNIAVLNQLTENDLVDILTKPENSMVAQYKKLFIMDGVELEFTKEALLKIAEVALKQKTGARGLKAIMERALVDLMFDTPNELTLSITVTKEMVCSTLEEK